MNTIVLFPGAGSQYIGMGKRLCEKYDRGNELFDKANEILGMDLKQKCFSGRLTELSIHENLQPAILTVSTIMYEAYIRENGIVPVMAAGHSLGEYSALVAAGVLSFEDALRLVKVRGRLFDHTKGAMTVAQETDEKTMDEIRLELEKEGHRVYVSCYNSDKQFILSGTEEGIYQAENKMSERNIPFNMMFSSMPVHCPLMKQVADVMAEEFEKYEFHDAKIPIICNSTGTICTKKEEIKENLIKQLVSPVLWTKSVEEMKAAQAECILEVGPKTVIGDLMKENGWDRENLSLDDKENQQRFLELIGSKSDTEIKPEQESIQLLEDCLRIFASTKNYNRMQTKEQYQTNVIEPVRSLKKQLKDVENDQKALSIEQKKSIINVLQELLKEKQVPDTVFSKKMQELRRYV